MERNKTKVTEQSYTAYTCNFKLHSSHPQLLLTKNVVKNAKLFHRLNLKL